MDTSRSPLPSLVHPNSSEGAPHTSSSLFNVLEAKAEVMPAFLDWTRDWNRKVTRGSQPERDR